MTAVGSSEMSNPDALGPASIKPRSTGSRDSESYPQSIASLTAKPFFLFPNVDLAALCKGVDDACRRPATYYSCHMGHPQILPLHAGPAVRTTPVSILLKLMVVLTPSTAMNS